MSCKKICVICIICEIPEPSRFKFVGICKICGTRKRKEDSERLPPVFKSPEEVPCPEDRLTHSLSRKIPHESYIPIHPLEIMPQLWFPKPIPFIMLSEVPGFQYLVQHKLTILLIRRNDKPRGRHAEHLLHDIHDSPSKLPQSQLLQFLLHHTQAVPSRTIWRDLWWSAILIAQRFRAPEGGYIPASWGRGAWGESGALFG